MLLSHVRWLVLVALLVSHPAAAEPPATVSHRDRFVTALEPVLGASALATATVGLHVVDVRSGEEIFGREPEELRLPASTMKVLTSATALRTLGPSYRFRTEIHHTGTIGDDGVLDGDLYVKGHGDPTMVVERLWRLVQEIKLNGVEEVKGDVVFDDTWLVTEPHIPGWNKTKDLDNGPSYFPPLGALGLNYNNVAIYVKPGSKVGGAARVELDTPTPVVEIENEVVTGSRGSRAWLRMERELEGRKTIFSLEGSVPAESGVRRYYRTVGDPTAYFVGTFASLCKIHGIKVGGRYLEAPLPDDASLLLQVESASLASILQDVNKMSNNFIAEQILATMGAEVRGAPGSVESGISVVLDYLEELGLSVDELRLANGSGLSRETFLTPMHLTAVLTDMYHDQRVGAEFKSSLAIGGRDGTLRRRFVDEDKVDRVRGKTGSLNGVYCLAGYLEAASGEVYAFAFLVNDIRGSVARIRQVHDDFAITLLDLDPPGEVAAVDTGEEFEEESAPQ